MINEVVLDWFCLINSKGVGPKTFWAVMRSYKTAKESLKHISDPFPKDKARKILKSLNCDVILASEPIFPRLLRRSSSCPPMLFCQGDKTILAKRKIAIIGARNASISGKSIAKNLAYNLSNDFAIVSGLARGIDTAAHQGSIENTQTKSTITVLPFGFENIYPQENVQLYKKIAKDGLVISETQHRNLNEQGAFYARNRIITLLSEAVVVIEAASKSGTMATAKMALDLGCEVLVIPGSPLDPRYYGSNFLIKNGAMLVQNHFDVLEAIGYQTEHNQISETQVSSQVEPTGNHNKSEEILSMLSETPISLDTLALNANIRMNELLCLISELEISGKVIKHSTNEVTIFRG